MSFIATTLEIPQSATELTTSDLQQISGGHGEYCDSDPQVRHHRRRHHFRKFFREHNREVANESVSVSIGQSL